MNRPGIYCLIEFEGYLYLFLFCNIRNVICYSYHICFAGKGRKDIIKSCYNYIILEDNITKQVAYAIISYFIEAYETPSN